MTIDQETLDSIKEQINQDYSSDELTLSEFSSFLDNLSTVLDYANSQARYKRLNIDVETDADLLNALISFLPRNKSFTEIAFSEKITADLKPFANSGNLNSIKQLIFQDFKLESIMIEQILQIINNCALDLLQFNSCFDDSTFEQLVSGLSNMNKFSEIPVIDFSNNTSPLILKHLSAFSSIKKLILQNCDLEILPFMQSLFSLNGIQIESIDLSGNQCTESNSGTLNFPLSLCEIILNEIQFEFTSFDSLFTALMEHSPQQDDAYHVSLSNIALRESEWKHFLSKIDKTKVSKLAKLTWSNNTISKSFIRFVNSVKSLLSLNISGCIDNSPETTSLIPTLLKQNYTLRELIIDTFDLNELDDDSTKIVVDNLKKNYSLKSLSLNDQPISDETVLGLADTLMVNRRIKKLVYNFSGIEEKETLLSFFKKLSDRGRPLYIKYPRDAIENLKASIDEYDQAEQAGSFENCNEGFLGELNKSYYKVINGDKSIKVPDESVAFANADGKIIIGGDNDNDDDDFNGINYDPIRKQDWTNNVASQIGATPEQMKQASTSVGDSGIQYQYVGLSDIPNQPSQVQPNYTGQINNQLPGNLFDLDDDEILEIVNGHRVDPSKVEANKLPISPEEYRLYKKTYKTDALNDVPLGNLPDLPPLGNINEVPVARSGGLPPPTDLPSLGNVNMFPQTNLPPPPPLISPGSIPPPPTGMVLPPPPKGMDIPPPDVSFPPRAKSIYVTKNGETPTEIAPYDSVDGK